jgi:hypothetical protein
MRSTVQMAASVSQVKTITAQSFFLSVLTINRMLALSVFKQTKGTGSASNKALKSLPSVVRTHLRGAASPLCPTQLRRLA